MDVHALNAAFRLRTFVQRSQQLRSPRPKYLIPGAALLEPQLFDRRDVGALAQHVVVTQRMSERGLCSRLAIVLEPLAKEAASGYRADVEYRRRKRVAAIVGYSGVLTGAADPAHQAIAKPPVLLIHGSADPIVPVSALHAAKAALHKLGIDVTEHVTAGLGHSVDPVGLRLGGEFIAKALHDES